MKHDIREAGRFLGANLGFTLVVVLTLGLAIGINATIFSVLNGVLLRPLGYVEPEQYGALKTRQEVEAERLKRINASTVFAPQQLVPSEDAQTVVVRERQGPPAV